jgi:hypothetical protein
MSQHDELARVKARITALAERTVARGCTEAEAMAAADKVGRLLERHALTMDEIDVRQTPCVEKKVPAGGLRRRPIDTCVPAIARFCDCKVWLAREPAPPSYVFFGFGTDTALASYLFAVIDRAIRSELEGFRMRRPELAGVRLRQASSDFQIGMAARVAERLTTTHAEREASVAAQRPTGTALVLLRHHVVEDAFRLGAPKLRSMSGLTFRQDQSFRAGRDAGERAICAGRCHPAGTPTSKDEQPPQ